MAISDRASGGRVADVGSPCQWLYEGETKTNLSEMQGKKKLDCHARANYRFHIWIDLLNERSALTNTQHHKFEYKELVYAHHENKACHRDCDLARRRRADRRRIRQRSSIE